MIIAKNTPTTQQQTAKVTEKTKLPKDKFINDLTDEERQVAINAGCEIVKNALQSKEVTVNMVSKIFCVEHARVKKICNESKSLKHFFDARRAKNTKAKLEKQIQLLTDEERINLIEKLQNMGQNV